MLKTTMVKLRDQLIFRNHSDDITSCKNLLGLWTKPMNEQRVFLVPTFKIYQRRKLKWVFKILYRIRVIMKSITPSVNKKEIFWINAGWSTAYISLFKRDCPRSTWTLLKFSDRNCGTHWNWNWPTPPLLDESNRRCRGYGPCIRMFESNETKRKNKCLKFFRFQKRNITSNIILITKTRSNTFGNRFNFGITQEFWIQRWIILATLLQYPWKIWSVHIMPPFIASGLQKKNIKRCPWRR